VHICESAFIFNRFVVLKCFLLGVSRIASRRDSHVENLGDDRKSFFNRVSESLRTINALH
jgi:hypothetical protein